MSTYIEGRIATQPPNNTETHRLIGQMRSVVTSAYEIWVSPEGDDDVGTGHFLFPYQTLPKAASMVTATRKKVMLMPGTYTLAASIQVPVGVTDILFSGITSDYESTVVHATAGDEVFNITPNATIGAANVLVFFANMYISAADGVRGVRIDNTNMTADKKLITTFRDCGFGAETDTDSSISMSHADADSSVKTYLNGRGMGGNNIEGLVSVDHGNAGDRFKATGMNFEGGIAFSTDAVASESEFYGCIMKNAGGSGGDNVQILGASGCISRDGTTHAAVALDDFADNAEEAFLNLA